MKKKVATGLLVALIAWNQVLGSSIAVSAMVNTTLTPGITLETTEQTDVITEESSTVVTDKTEEKDSVTIPEEPSTGITNKTEEKDTTISEETNSSTIMEDSKTDKEVSESYIDIRKNPRLTSSAQIQPTKVVTVYTETNLRDAINSGDTLIKLEKDITLTAPLEINNKSTIVIDGQGNTIKLNEDATKKQNMFIMKYGSGIVVKDVTIEDYYSTALSLYKTTNVFLEKVVLKGQDRTNPNDTRSNVGVDMDGSIAEIRDMESINHRYAGIRVRNMSELTLDGWNKHMNDTNDIDSQVKTGNEDNVINDNARNYSEWEVKPGSGQTSTIYKVKTKVDVHDITKFKEAIAIDNTTIELKHDININENIEIKAKNITINGNSHRINIISNASTNNGTNTSALVVKSKNTVLSNLTIHNSTTKPGLTLYGAENAELSNIQIIGKDPATVTDNKERSGVALDIYKTTVKLKDMTFANSLYRDVQVRGGSEVEILSKNVHSTGVVHIQSIKKENEADNRIMDASNLYLAGVEFEENGETKVDYFLKIEIEATTIKDILDNIKTGGTVVKLQNDIRLDWDDLPEDDPDSLKIEVNRNVTIDGNGKTLYLDGFGSIVIKGKDIIVKNLTIDNSYEHGVNIYNSKNVLLDNVVLSNSYLSGIFVNGSTVVLRDVSTLNSVDDGIKITRSRTLNSPSHFDSEVKVEGTLTQKESNVSVNIMNLEMLDGTKQNNKFIPQPDTYIHHIDDENHKKLSDYYIELFGIQGTPAAEKEYWEQEHDYMVLRGEIDVTNQQTVLDEHGQPIQLVGDGVTDNTDNLIKLIEYAGTHSQALYFPAGTYKITKDIDLSKINLPAMSASNFKLLGDENGLSIIDGSSNVDKMLEIFNDRYQSPMNYVDIEHLVFHNVGVSINGPYKKGITLKHNVFVNGNYTREKRADGSVSKVTMEPYIEVKNSKYVIEHNIFLRGKQYPGRGISTYRSKNTTIKNNFFGSLDGISDAVLMIPEIASKLSIIKGTNLVNGDQGNFFTAINNERYDTNVLIQNNYFNLMKTRNVVSDFASDTLISGINVAADGQRRDHIIYSKGYDNLQIVGNYFKGQENGAAGGVKIRNGKNAYIGANYFDDVPLLTYIYPDLTKAETLLHNTVIYNNLFHQKTNFGLQGTGILFYQSFRDGDNLTYKDGDVWNDAYGDVKDFIIYQNEFKSDERDQITITGRAKKAYDDNQFLAYDNKYKHTNELVNYHTQGNFGLTESSFNEIQDKVIQNDGYNSFKAVGIPLTPAKADYTYLKEIYAVAKPFLDNIVNNDLVGDSPGQYNPDLVKQLQDMLEEITNLYTNGQLRQLETNRYVTSLDELYTKVKDSLNPPITPVPPTEDESDSDNDFDSDNESDSNNGPGSGTGNGSGSNNGSGSGTGNGSGSNNGSGSGTGNGSGSNNGSGSGTGNGSGSNNGSGSGTGNGSGSNNGSGSGTGNGLGSNNGSGSGTGNGSGSSTGLGSGTGSGLGTMSGSGNGPGTGTSSGSGQGIDSSTVSGLVTGTGTSTGSGNATKPNTGTSLDNDSTLGLGNGADSSDESDSVNKDSKTEKEQDSFVSQAFEIVKKPFVWLPFLLLLLLLLFKRKKKKEEEQQ